MTLEGKIGFVTGAANGIGHGIALELAAEGATVVISDLESARAEGEAVVAEIAAAGGRALFVAADVTSDDDIARLFAEATRLGPLDFVVNNAGIGPKATIAEMEDGMFDTTMAINLRAVWKIMKAAIKTFEGQGTGGNIVNISSVAGTTGLPTAGAYVAAKHGVIGLTKTAAAENGAKGIRVNAILPNAIKSNLMKGQTDEFLRSIIEPQAIPRLGEPREVGAAVAFLLSDKAAFITGVSLPVDGGFLATNG